MLKKISDWILSNSHYEVKCNANDFTDSLVVDIDDDTKIARFTVWDDASCMLEIIDVETGNYIINEPLLRTRGGAFHHAGSDRVGRRVEPVSVCAEPADVGGSVGVE